MSKFGKFVMKTALVGAALYGAYYYLKKEEVLTPLAEDDEISDYDEDLDDDTTKTRSYINLSFDKAKAEDLAKNAVIKAKATITDSVQKVEEFFNDDPSEIIEKAKKVADDVKDAVSSAAENVAENISEAVANATSEEEPPVTTENQAEDQPSEDQEKVANEISDSENGSQDSSSESEFKEDVFIQ